MIHMPPEWIDTVRKILGFYAPGKRIVVFGSRASGIRLKPHSDLDLCIMGDEAMEAKSLRQLREAFAVSDLPIRVDIVDWAEASPVFRQNILEYSEDIL
jgi:uncharacterized protein